MRRKLLNVAISPILQGGGKGWLQWKAILFLRIVAACLIDRPHSHPSLSSLSDDKKGQMNRHLVLANYMHARRDNFHEISLIGRKKLIEL